MTPIVCSRNINRSNIKILDSWISSLDHPFDLSPQRSIHSFVSLIKQVYVWMVTYNSEDLINTLIVYLGGEATNKSETRFRKLNSRPKRHRYFFYCPARNIVIFATLAISLLDINQLVPMQTFIACYELLSLLRS